jgi:general secretion pathway protein D
MAFFVLLKHPDSPLPGPVLKQSLLARIGICLLLLCMGAFILCSPIQAQDKAQKTVTLDFDQVDLKVFIKFISNLTGKNFVVDDKVRGNVTILSPTPLTVEGAYQVFLSVLEVQGYTTIPSGNVIKIVRTVESRQKNMETSSRLSIEPRPEDQVITQVIPLEFATAAELRKILVPMVSKQGLIVSYNPTETLILIDYESNVNRLLKIIDMVDVKAFDGTISLVQLENASAADVASKLSNLLAAGQKGKQAAQQGQIAFVADERTNSIIFMADPDQTQKVEEMITKLDQPTPKNLSNIQVVALENAQAEDLAGVLSSLSGQKSSEKGEAVISSNVSIVADKPSNSLVIIAEPKEFQTLMPIIKSLDAPRKQVYVEAAIVEVSTDSSLNLGINWQGASDFGGGSSEGVLFGATNDLVGSSVDDITSAIGNSQSVLSFGVLSFPFTFNGEDYFSLGAFINASQNDNSVQIISTPQLMTMENEEAKVVIAENRPFITSREETEAGNDFTNFEYKDVGVTLKVTPLINNKGWVKLNLFQEVSRIDPNVEFTSQTPITRKRTAETTVRVKDGQTVVIAGLMEDKNSNTESKVPGLGDIPVFGHLFKNTSKEDSKTNLMIFITPHVVDSLEDARNMTLDKSKLLNKLRFDIDGHVKPISSSFILHQPLQ